MSDRGLPGPDPPVERGAAALAADPAPTARGERIQGLLREMRPDLKWLLLQHRIPTAARDRAAGSEADESVPVTGCVAAGVDAARVRSGSSLSFGTPATLAYTPLASN